MEENTVAKKNKNEVAENTNTTSTDTLDTTLDGERPETPEDMEEMQGMQGGPMGGGFPGEMTTMQGSDTNEWLAPMVGAGITSGVVIIAAVVLGWMMMRLEKKLKKN